MICVHVIVTRFKMVEEGGKGERGWEEDGTEERGEGREKWQKI